ncbi:MAG: hypothetical protein ACRD43_00450 [Pyrinomonadaceae bacterium]
MIVGYLIGFLIVAGAVSLISALLIGMGAGIFIKTPIPFATRFWVSAVAIAVTFALQWLIQNALQTNHGFFVAVPGFSFFAVSWLLITGYLNNNTESKSGNVVKGLLVAVFQCLSLIAVALIVAFAIIGLTRR